MNARAVLDLDRARDALFACNPACPREEWVRVAMAAKSAGLDLDTFAQWSSMAGDLYDARDTASMWRSIRCGGIGPGTLFKAAIDAGWRPSPPSASPTLNIVPRKMPARPAERPLRETLSDGGKRFWDACKPVCGSVGEQYLLARHCAIPPVDRDLRFHPAVPHQSGYVGPALVALVTNVATRVPLSLHRTWIQADGSKAAVEPARSLLRGHRKAGGVIRLWPDEAVTTGLGIAEGIETALSLAHAFKPVWACIDAGNLADFPVLAGIECLTIAADHDHAGIAAARVCATRWTRAGREVYVVMPDHDGKDLNDIAREEDA